MSRGDAKEPSIDATIEALEQLTDIVIAAQELTAKFRDHGRPFLAYCARELEDDCHNMFHQVELISSGWEPLPNADR